MSKLKLQMQISVDGFVATGPNDEQKWVTLVWDEVKQYVLELSDTTDTIVIGRKLAVDYIPYWENVLTKPDDPFYEVAQRIVRSRKELKKSITYNSGLVLLNYELRKQK